MFGLFNKETKGKPTTQTTKPQAKTQTTAQTQTTPAKAKTPLTSEDKKQIKSVLAKHKPTGKNEKSAQESVPFQRIYKDGICNVEGDFYSKTVQFQDINYKLADNEDKIAIFDGWCGFLNQFDTSVEFQFSFLNIEGNELTFEQSINISHQGDNFDSIREEYSEMLRKQLAKGNNGIVKRKYITFGIHAESYKKAKPRLERLELDIYGNLKKMGVQTETLDGKQRLELFHNFLRMNEKEKFKFEWDWLAPTGLSTKDFIVPSSFWFGDGRYFKTGETFGATSFLQILAPEISDEILTEYLDCEGNQAVAMHVQSIDHVKAIKMIKSKLSDLEKVKIDEQKKAVRSGYDMDVLPSDLGVYVSEAKKLLQDLQSRNERLFYFSFIITHTADSKEQLENNVFQATSIAQKQTCALVRLDYQQEQGFFSCLPLGKSLLNLSRCMTSSATGGFVPFTTSELFQEGTALYYGINALSNNLLMADRKRLKNPNGLILGTPGSGKSFAAKREIVNVFLITNDDIAILDPESEYAPLVSRLEGQVIKISPLSKDYINPMDINLDDDEGENPLILKSDFILSLFEIMMGEVKPDEKSLIDNSLQLTYMPYFENPEATEMPILEDLYNTIKSFDSPQAKHICDCMAIYVTGSLNVFNHRTNVDISNRVVCFDTKELGNALKEFGMLVVQDQVWGRVSKNRDQRKSTRYYIDEMHLLLGKEQTSNYTVEIWKRFRKWGGIPTGLTQNVKDFLCSPKVANIFENSDFVYLLNQAGGDREILAKQLNISTHQLGHVKNSNAGEGLLIYGSTIIPFVDHFPTNTELYKIMTTKLDEVEQPKKEVTLKKEGDF